MTTRRPQPHTLAGAYALDALTGADRARFERHLARCPACAEEIAGLREATARLAAAAAAAPPPGLICRALAAAAQTRQLPPLPARRPLPWLPGAARPAARAGPPRRGWLPRLALALAAAVIAVAAILAAATRTAQHQLAAGQARDHAIATVLTAPDATMLTARARDGGTVTVVMSARGHALVFAAAGLPALPPSRCYQLWLIRPGGQDTTAALLAGPGMTGPVLASGLTPGDRLGLSIEPASGTARPTTAMILVLTL